MARTDAIEVEGSVVAVLSPAVCRVELANGHQVLAHTRGRGGKAAVDFAPGDRVILEMSPFDLSKGRIVGNSNKK